jgi:hypothetical protein
MGYLLLVGLIATGVSAYHYFGPPGWKVRQGTSMASGQFTPALFLAAGRGFVEPADYSAPEVAPFLRGETDQFVPASLPVDFPVVEPHPWDQQHRYLYYTAALIWKVLGISWTALKVLPISLFAFFAMASYAVFRHAGKRLPAAILALSYCMLSGAVGLHATVRDFSKGPFFLAGFFLLLCLLRYRMSSARFCMTAAVLGAVAGIGAGFRQDLVMLLPPALVVLMFGARPRAARVWSLRIAGAVLMLGVFALLGWPVVGAYQGSNTAHDTLMGFSTPVGNDLGLGSADYEHIPIQSDTLIHALQVHALQRGSLPTPGASTATSRDIDRAGRGLVVALIATYPADALSRAYAAMLWVLTGGVVVADDTTGEMVTGPWVSGLIVGWRLLMGCVLPVLLVYALGAWDFRRGLATVAACAMLFGYVSIQFGHRHAFHLTLVPLWLLLYLATQLRLRRAGPDAWSFLLSRNAARQGGALLLLCALGLAVPWFVAGRIQHVRVGLLVQQYRTADTEPLPTAERALGDAWTLFAPVTRADARATPYSPVNWPFCAEYLVARFEAAPEPMRVFVKYETDDSVADFTFDAVFRGECSRNGAIDFMVPILENPLDDGGWWSRFGGIVLRKQDAGRFMGLYRIRSTDAFPFWSNYKIYPEDSPVHWARKLSVRGRPIDTWKPPLRVFPTFAPRVYNDHRCRMGSVLDPTGPGIPDLRAALEVDPRDAGLLARLGKALATAGDDAGAEAVYRRLIDVAPDNFVGYKGLYELHARVHSPETRLALWRGIADAYPAHLHGSLYLARLELEAGEPAAAEAAYRNAEARSPVRLRSLQSVATALRSRGYLSEPLTN